MRKVGKGKGKTILTAHSNGKGEGRGGEGRGGEEMQSVFSAQTITFVALQYILHNQSRI
jgi:hypothetical protein